MESKKFFIKKLDKSQLVTSVANIFNQDSDEEKTDITAKEKFDRKYAVNLKNKEKRLMESAIAADPTVYEYDSIYDELERKKNLKTEVQEKSDKEKKPKYVDNIKKTHQRRELEKLLHDEHTYKKERLAEAGKFDEKEVYVTGAYRKQIEERDKFRKEIEEEDALEEKFSIFAYKKKFEQEEEEYNQKNKEKKSVIIENDNQNEEKNDVEKKIEREKSTKESSSYSNKKFDEKIETEKRMKKLREILKQRNSEDDIMEARKRYFERLNSEDIIPPLFLK